jgi:hypothetical protein
MLGFVNHFAPVTRPKVLQKTLAFFSCITRAICDVCPVSQEPIQQLQDMKKPECSDLLRARDVSGLSGFPILNHLLMTVTLIRAWPSPIPAKTGA